MSNRFTGKTIRAWALGPEVWIEGNRDQVRSIRSVCAGGDGMLVRSYAVDYNLGYVRVENPGQVRAARSKSGGYRWLADQG